MKAVPPATFSNSQFAGYIRSEWRFIGEEFASSIIYMLVPKEKAHLFHSICSLMLHIFNIEHVSALYVTIRAVCTNALGMSDFAPANIMRNCLHAPRGQRHHVTSNTQFGGTFCHLRRGWGGLRRRRMECHRFHCSQRERERKLASEYIINAEPLFKQLTREFVRSTCFCACVLLCQHELRTIRHKGHVL